jgi:pimeloyl-ACP methyl ester carboxylesterase
MHWVLLPGFDGTGLLFEPLKRALPKAAAVSIVSYPSQALRSYPELVRLVTAALPRDTPYVLIAESFSGPIAIQAAAAAAVRPKALVLCASFAVCPVGPVLAAMGRLAGGLLFQLRPPVGFVRRYLLGADAPAQLLEDFYRALASVSASVLRNRLDSVLRVNVLADLAALSMPVLYIQGSQDMLVGARSLRIIQECNPRVQIETVDAPHLILQREPERCAELIQRFLDATQKVNRS